MKYWLLSNEVNDEYKIGEKVIHAQMFFKMILTYTYSMNFNIKKMMVKFV